MVLVEGIAVKECVLDYTAPDGSTFREYVPLQTILDSAAAIAHLPVTLQHPDEDVTPDNVDALAVGNVDSEVVVEDGGYTRVKMAIRARRAIDAISAGIHELSLGYQVQVEQTPGRHPEFGDYDAVQVARRMNHIALVDQARVGPEARIRFDGIATRRLDAATPAAKAQGATMNQGFLSLFALLGLAPRRCDTDDAAIALLDGALRARKDAEEAEEAKAEAEAKTAEKAMAEQKDKLDQLQATYDALKAEADALKADKAAAEDKADRARLAPLCAALKVDAAQHKSRKDLHLALAKAKRGDALPANASEAYIDATVDLALDELATKTDGRETGRKAWEQPQQQNEPARQDGQPLLTANQKLAARLAQKGAA